MFIGSLLVIVALELICMAVVVRTESGYAWRKPVDKGCLRMGIFSGIGGLGIIAVFIFF